MPRIDASARHYCFPSLEAKPFFRLARGTRTVEAFMMSTSDAHDESGQRKKQ
ncbi:hypothetical protein ZHAS_00021235 [Anopheles sinensis]|uniref:Uncharacterized protein n=1 Tax=Anopheles sinensis TaxID=74873 RepID=A0A084WRW1_ANOSI|nr:hypothetical protein ZHAS_00021235 [Anopheles sinensis]